MWSFWERGKGDMRTAMPKPSIRKLLIVVGIGAVIASGPVLLRGQSPAFSINPMRMEMEVSPGTEKTVAFEVKAAASPLPERGRVVLSLTDWSIREDGTASYLEAGSSERSASSWITFSPAALTTEPGRTQLVRITANVPEKTAPGVYRTALFVQDRPDAAPPTPGERAIHIRVRFAFTLYVIVPPVSAHPELVNIEMDTSQGPPRLICEMKNTGSRHTRPLLLWSIRPKTSTQIAAKGKIEATVLLPVSSYREPHTLQRDPLSPGGYEVLVLADFQDGQPLQSMSRTFEVTAGAPPPQLELPPAVPKTTAPENTPPRADLGVPGAPGSPALPTIGIPPVEKQAPLRAIRISERK